MHIVNITAGSLHLKTRNVVFLLASGNKQGGVSPGVALNIKHAMIVSRVIQFLRPQSIQIFTNLKPPQHFAEKVLMLNTVLGVLISTPYACILTCWWCSLSLVIN